MGFFGWLQKAIATSGDIQRYCTNCEKVVTAKWTSWLFGGTIEKCKCKAEEPKGTNQKLQKLYKGPTCNSKISDPNCSDCSCDSTKYYYKSSTNVEISAGKWEPTGNKMMCADCNNEYRVKGHCNSCNKEVDLMPTLSHILSYSLIDAYQTVIR